MSIKKQIMTKYSLVLLSTQEIRYFLCILWYLRAWWGCQTSFCECYLWGPLTSSLQICDHPEEYVQLSVLPVHVCTGMMNDDLSLMFYYNHLPFRGGILTMPPTSGALDSKHSQSRQHFFFVYHKKSPIYKQSWWLPSFLCPSHSPWISSWLESVWNHQMVQINLVCICSLPSINHKLAQIISQLLNIEYE